MLGVPTEEEDDGLKKEEIFNSLSQEHVYTTADSYMRTRDMSIEVRMLKKVLEYMFLPKLSATEQVTAGEANVLWRVYTYQRVSLPGLMFTAFGHLPQRTDHVVPYGVWLTRIFEHFRVPLDGEAYIQVSAQVKDWVGATLLKRMGVRMSHYIEEMDAFHEMEASGEEAEESGEREEAEEREEGGRQERDNPDDTTRVDAAGTAERPSSPRTSAQAQAGHRSSAYTMLADEMCVLKAEMKELTAAVSSTRREMSAIERKVDLLLSHFGIMSPAPEAPPPAVDPSQGPDPTFTIEELTAEHTPTHAEHLRPSSPAEPHS